MSELVLLQSYFHKHDAQIAVGLLNDAGIEAILQSDDAGGFRPHLTLAMGNNRVMVHQKDAERALEVIQSLKQDFSEQEMQDIEEMALEAKPPPDPPKIKKFNKDLSIAIPLIIAALFVLSYVLQELHTKKIITAGSSLPGQCEPIGPERNRRFSCKTYFLTGQLMGERIYHNNRLHGPSKEYYYNGQVLWEGTYVNNALNGRVREYYPGGALKGEANYKNDELQGEDKEYYESGPIKFHARYRNDEPHGPLHIYYEDGTRAYEWNFENGYLLDSNGERFTGKKTTYHANGKLWEEFNCKKGVIDGTLRLYYQDGTLKHEETYRNGDLHGESIEYYPNGQVEVRDVYADDEIVSTKVYDLEEKLIWKDTFR